MVGVDDAEAELPPRVDVEGMEAGPAGVEKPPVFDFLCPAGVILPFPPFRLVFPVEADYFPGRQPVAEIVLGAVELGTDQGVEAQGLAEPAGELLHLSQFITVQGADHRLQAERYLPVRQQPDRLPAAAEAPRSPGDPVRGFFGSAEDRDIDVEGRVAGQEVGGLPVDQGGVGEDHDQETLAERPQVDIAEILPQERFPAGEGQKEAALRPELVEEVEQFLPGQLFFRGGGAGEADVAVGAGEVATPGQFDRTVEGQPFFPPPVEQTGEGKMKIDGQVSGSYADNLPRIDINFSAEEMAFTVHAVNQSVNGIRFEGFATNGGRQDLSEAALRISNFHVAFPTGTVEADLEVSNLRSPEIRLMIEGGVDLAIIDEILDNASVHSMDGHVRIAGEVDGTVDLEAGNFSEGGGGIGISAEEASFLVAGHAVQALNGTFYMDDKTFEARQIGMQIDGNDLRFSITAGGLLPYLLNIPAHPWVTVELAADELFLDKILGDTLLPGPVRNFSLEAGVSLADSELDRVLHNGAIPVAVMDIRHLGFLVPGYAPVSDLRLVLNLEEERMVLSEMHVASGESRLAFGMELENYRAFLAGDSAAVLTLLFDLDAEQLLARDLLTVKDTFSLLPAYFEGEEIADLKFKGKVKTTVGEVLDTSKIPNVEFICENLQWELKGYPHGFRNFSADVELVDSLLIVNGFRGTVGENNIDLRASVLHLMDSTKTISGSMDIRSSLLDFDQLLDYPLLTGTVGDTVSLGEEGLALPEDSIVEAVPGIGDFDFPGLELTMDMEELRYGELDFRNLRGKIEVVPEKMVYLDHFFVQTVSGGSFLVDGTFDVADPEHYTFVSSIEIDTVNVSDFDLQFAMEDSIYSLEDNFNGLLSTDATVEMFINPDFSIDLESTTARFDVVLRDGRVKNFAPLHAIAKYTGNKDLDNVKFGELRNGMSITLAEGVIKIPLMSIESTLGLILIEGEQSLAGDFLYLVRVPTRLIRGTARNMLSGQQRREEEAEDEIQTMKAQKFAVLTVYGKGETVEVKMGDKREDY